MALEWQNYFPVSMRCSAAVRWVELIFTPPSGWEIACDCERVFLLAAPASADDLVAIIGNAVRVLERR